MKDFQDDEYCLFINGGVGSDLWSLVAGQALDDLLSDPTSWEYQEPERWTCVASGDRDIHELEEGMCDRECSTPPVETPTPGRP
ncbi:hypothetical protein [Streptomyces sp. NPDC051684]|uniref:hypothetical protein n=1 Tax=Streptomyces sp. NPDC051684 TaxID=3365670 RepID=UPI00378F3AD7